MEELIQFPAKASTNFIIARRRGKIHGAPRFGQGGKDCRRQPETGSAAGKSGPGGEWFDAHAQRVTFWEPRLNVHCVIFTLGFRRFSGKLKVP
jgi:hypothetical protein